MKLESRREHAPRTAGPTSMQISTPISLLYIFYRWYHEMRYVIMQRELETEGGNEFGEWLDLD